MPALRQGNDPERNVGGSIFSSSGSAPVPGSQSWVPNYCDYLALACWVSTTLGPSDTIASS
ncbi:MAG: hypothetical protein RMM58_06850 [Chloroflexota bacterium]|nr:hypothetical protein [Dehalococcoidia bacterium]MDW8253580.1 hypothetical protein [Chloroflexota bacterium]